MSEPYETAVLTPLFSAVVLAWLGFAVDGYFASFALAVTALALLLLALWIDTRGADTEALP